MIRVSCTGRGALDELSSVVAGSDGVPVVGMPDADWGRRWTGGFRDRGLQSAYERWRTARAVPSMQVGSLLVLVAGGAFILGGLVFDPTFARGFLPSVAAASPGFLLALLAIRAPDHRVVQVVVALATLTWGAAILWGTHHALGAPEVGTVGIVVVVLYALQVFRVGPSLAGPLVVLLGAMHVALLVRGGAPVPAGGWFFHVSLTVILVVASLVVASVNDRADQQHFRQERTIEAQARVIDLERRRADTLVRRMLPPTVVEQLQSLPAGQRLVQHHDEVTVLFTDVVGFTPLSTRLPAPAVVELLETLFRWMDELARRHGVEKIKSVGDAYMAVAGAPTEHPDPAAAVARMALDLRDGIGALAGRLPVPVQLHTGLATGSAIGGVMDGDRIFYDLWSDTVNTAARLQASAPPQAIHVDGPTAARLQGRFHLVELAPLDLRGKGPTPAWSLAGPVPRSDPPAPALSAEA